jgi:hypothetical protein
MYFSPINTFSVHEYSDLLFPICSPGKSICTSSILLGLVLVGRAAFVFPLSFLSNLTKKTSMEKITWRQQVSNSLDHFSAEITFSIGSSCN